MVRRTKEDALQTRERIIDAAIEVFHERGVSRPSLSEVAARVGLTRGAVYGHFRNKSDVLSAVFARVHLPMEVICEVAPATCGADPLGSLRSAWVALLREVAGNPDWQRIYEILFHRCELVDEIGDLTTRCQATHHEGERRLAELLRQAMAAGQLPADLDPEAATFFLGSGIAGMLNSWLFRRQSIDLSAAAERCIDALLAGLCSPALRIPSVPASRRLAAAGRAKPRSAVGRKQAAARLPAR